MKKDKIYIICGLWIIIDQMIKLLIKNNMSLLSTIPVIPNFFSITYIENSGAAWGIMSDQTLILIIVSIIVFFFLDREITKEKNISKLVGVSYGIIMGGIVGNLIDRLLYGGVIDYLAFNLFGYDAPIFNFADIGIVVGICLLLFELVRSEVLNGRRKRCRNTR